LYGFLTNKHDDGGGGGDDRDTDTSGRLIGYHMWPIEWHATNTNDLE